MNLILKAKQVRFGLKSTQNKLVEPELKGVELGVYIIATCLCVLSICWVVIGGK